MKDRIMSIALTVAAGLTFSGCGLNPFGAGQGGLSIFAKIGKAMQKPSAIHDEQNTKQNAQATVESGALTKRLLAKAAVGNADKPWLDTNYIARISGNQFKYVEEVTDKPGEADPQNLYTGIAYVVFRYSGDPNITLATINTSLITDIDTFYGCGIEEKTWRGEIDSLETKVVFGSTVLNDIKPGKIWVRGRNVSPLLELGRDDSAYFELDSLDDATHTQYGGGNYTDAHTGKDNTGPAYSFNFDLTVMHKNNLDPSKPYERWQDNEGEVTFTIPWGNTGDSLYFLIHFLPNYERWGRIYKNNDSGPMLVSFTHNEKTRVGEIIYYDEEGNQIGRE